MLGKNNKNQNNNYLILLHKVRNTIENDYENGFKNDPTNILKDVKALWNELFRDQSFFNYLKDLEKKGNKIGVTNITNRILQDVFDTIYTDRIVDFFKYNYVREYDDTDTVDFIKSTVALDIDYRTTTGVISKEDDLANMISKVGIKGTIEIIHTLFTKAYVHHVM